jgi:hypothetical protein
VPDAVLVCASVVQVVAEAPLYNFTVYPAVPPDQPTVTVLDCPVWTDVGEAEIVTPVRAAPTVREAVEDEEAPVASAIFTLMVYDPAAVEVTVHVALDDVHPDEAVTPEVRLQV